MSTQIITPEDLTALKKELLDAFEQLLIKYRTTNTESLQGMRTKQVRKILDCSNGKLQLLRIQGKLRCKKIGGTLYYNKTDVESLLSNA